jgi:hypothetical protein
MNITKSCRFHQESIKQLITVYLILLRNRYLALLEDGMFDDMNEYLIKELDELQEIKIDETPERTTKNKD